MRGQFLEWGEGAAASLDAGLTSRYAASERTSRRCRPGWPGTSRLRARPRRRPPVDAGARGRRRRRALRRELLSIAMLLLAAGLRDHGQPDRQRGRAAAAHPEQLAAAARRAGAVAERGRGGAALRLPGAAHRAARPPRHRGGRASRSAGRFVVSCWAAPTATRRCSPTRPVRRHPAPTPASTSRSPAASTTASARRWPGWRARSALRALFDRFPDLAPAGRRTAGPTRILRG